MDHPVRATGAPDRGWRRRWLKAARKAFVCSSLLLLLAAQVFGAIHMRGSPGLELLVAALTPGFTLLCLLQWLAGRHRLKWCVALEQVGFGAVLSVLLAVGLELISALFFGGELRTCSPPPNTKAPFAVAGTAGFSPLDHQLEPPAASVAQLNQGTAYSVWPSYTALFQVLLDTQVVGCGVGSRGVSRHLISYVSGHRTRSVEIREPLIKGGTRYETSTYLCVGFIFAWFGGAAFLRFATIENLSYVFATKSDMETALATAWVRAFTAIPSHAANTGIGACFLATAAATAAASTARASWRAADAAAAAAAVEEGEAGYLQGQEVRTVGEAHAVDVTTSNSNTSGTPTPPSLAEAKSINPFSFRLLLQSAVLPGLLHGCYDAALTLASAAYIGGDMDGSTVLASGWLMVALVAWWASIITFCSRWCNTKRFEEFYVYFSGPLYTGAPQIGGVPPVRPTLVVPAPRHALYLAEPQQHQLLQQQLLQQQFAPIPADAAAWQQQQNEQLLWQQQQQLNAPMYRQYAPILSPLAQHQQPERNS